MADVTDFKNARFRRDFQIGTARWNELKTIVDEFETKLDGFVAKHGEHFAYLIADVLAESMVRYGANVAKLRGKALVDILCISLDLGFDWNDEFKLWLLADVPKIGDVDDISDERYEGEIWKKREK